MSSSRFQQTTSSPASGPRTSSYPGVIDTPHHGLGSHFLLPPFKFQGDYTTQATQTTQAIQANQANQATQALDYKAFVSRFSLTPPCGASLSKAQVDGPPTPNYCTPFLLDTGLPSPFPSWFFPISNADHFTSGSLRDSATQVEGFPSRQGIHQEQSSACTTSSDIWSKGYPAPDQVDPTYQRPSILKPLPVSSLVSIFSLYTIEKADHVSSLIFLTLARSAR